MAWASSGVITVTRVSFGNGYPGVSDYVPGYTALKNQIQNGVIQGINNLVQGQLTVRSTLSSASAPSSYNINERASRPRNNIAYKPVIAASQALVILRNTSVPLACHT